MKSVKAKLAKLVITAVATSVLIVSLASTWRDADRRFTAKRAEILGIASAIATSVAQPLSAGDGDSVARTLSAIGRIPGFTYARISDMQGKTVHQFGFGVVISREPGLILPNPKIDPFSVFYLKTYPVAAPIVSGGVQIGKLTLIADLSELHSALRDGLLSALVAGIIASTVGLLLSRRLQKDISDPVESLTEAMDEIARSKDFKRSVAKSSDDEIGRLVEAFNDMMSEVQVRDSALAAHRENLEVEVRTRTRQFQEATEAAQAASAAKSEFLATMSHEIRTPMNGMLVMAELLATGDLAPRLQRYADVMLNSGQTLVAIINDILDFSKIEAGKLELEMVPVDLRRLIDDTLMLFNGRAVSKGLHLASDVEPEVPLSIAADPVRLTQIVSNLVNNALKFTEEGSVVVTATAAPPTDGATRWVEIHVCDTGIGIPDDKIVTIFSAFTQVDQSTARRFGGTGIGLTICQRLVTAMGGTISVASRIGEGSTFTVRIPVTVLAESPGLPNMTSECGNTIVIAYQLPAIAGILSAAARRRGFHPVVVRPQDVAAHHLRGTRCLIVGSADMGLLANALEIAGRDGIRPTVVSVATFGGSGTAEMPGGAMADYMLEMPLSNAGVEDCFNAIVRARIDAPCVLKEETEATRHEADLSELRVLAADDNPVNREVLSEALRRLGVRVVCVENGLAAVRAAQSQPFDIVLMDCSMPVMDGFEATRQIRDWERSANHPPRPIIALTAYVVGEAADMWRTAGMTGYLTKPYTLRSLRQCLESSGALRQCSAKSALQHPNTKVMAAPPKSGELSLVTDLIDPSVLGSMREMEEPGEQLVERIIGLFSQHASQAVTTLREFTATAKPEAVADAAHALRSMGLNIGALRIVDICTALENDARRGDLTKLESYCSTLSTTVPETIAALTVFVTDGTSHSQSQEAAA